MEPICAAEYFGRSFLAIAFGSALAGKLGSWREFEQAVREIAGFGPAATAIAAGVVAVLEAACALSTLFDREVAMAGAAAALALFVAFTFILAWVLRQGQMISCRCFGGQDKIISVYDIYRNIGFILVDVGYLAVLAQSGRGGCGAPGAEFALMSCAALICFLVLTNLKQVALVR